VHLIGFIKRIYHNAWSSECHIWELFVISSKAIKEENLWVSRQAFYQHKLTNPLHKQSPWTALELLHHHGLDTATQLISAAISFLKWPNKWKSLRDSGFWWHCHKGFRSFRIWHCATGWMVPISERSYFFDCPDLCDVILCQSVYSSQCSEGSYCFLARLFYRWMHYQSWE
jgi:hypothetical protein